MAQALRPNKKATQIAYTVLKTPKELQQGNKKPTKKQLEGWFRDSSTSQ
jgi:hypothetical protein